VEGHGDDESPCLTLASDLVASVTTGFGPIPGSERGNALVADRNARVSIAARCKPYGGDGIQTILPPATSWTEARLPAAGGDVGNA